MNENYFNDLYSVNCSDKIEKKNGLSYLSWAWAWAEVKKRYPDSTYTIYENKDGWNYFTDGRTCWVKTGVTICGIEHIEDLPVMDFKNRSIPLEIVTSFDVNKAIQRSLTKAVARHGLGLYIYAGEDLPEDGKEREPNVYGADSNELFLQDLRKEIYKIGAENGMTPEAVDDYVKAKFNVSGMEALDRQQLVGVGQLFKKAQRAKK